MLVFIIFIQKKSKDCINNPYINIFILCAMILRLYAFSQYHFGICSITPAVVSTFTT
jgi:hypothetical protein